MKRLMVAAALAPLSFAAMAFGGRAQADTTVSTATTTYNDPFSIARKLATIDHISKGRAG